MTNHLQYTRHQQTTVRFTLFMVDAQLMQ